MTGRARLLLTLLLTLTTPVLALGTPAEAASTRETVVAVGVLAFRGSEISLEQWEPTRRALEQSLPDIAFQLIPLDLDGTHRSAASGDIDFLITNPGNYVDLEHAYGVTRIATLMSKRPVASAVVVRADRDDLRRLEDLRGKRLAAVDPQAFGGFQLGWGEMARRGIDPRTDTSITFTGFPMDQVAQAVAEGRADAGIVRACLIEELAATGEVGGLRVLEPRPMPEYPCAATSEVFPDWPFAALRHTSRALAKRVATALLSFEPEPGQPAWTVPLDYTPVHALFQELHLGPYARLRTPTLVEVFWRYWQWVAMAALAMLWWVLHVWRVEHLVRQRTRDLERVNQDLQREMQERARLEEEDRRHRQELEHTARLTILGEMSANLAHEINQPLAAITNYADGCQLRLRAGNLDGAAFLDVTRRIREQADRAAAIIHAIRGFVKRREPERATLDVNATVKDAVDLFEGQARRGQTVLDCGFAPNLPAIEGDRIRIQQVLLNLLQNGVDAMGATDPARRRLRVVTSSGSSGWIEIYVADTGCGMSAQTRDRLFEPYFTTKPDGIGLGLAISRSIVESLGGRLWAEDNPGGGTVMRVALPAAVAGGVRHDAVEETTR